MTYKMDPLNEKAVKERRQKKEANRKKIKEERKNRLREKAAQVAIKKDSTFGKTKEQVKEANFKKTQEEANREQITEEFISQISFSEKLGLIKAIKNEVISFPAYRYRKLRDLLTFCKEPKQIDVVLKSIEALCEVFCDIIPSYRIREYSNKEQ